MKSLLKNDFKETWKDALIVSICIIVGFIFFSVSFVVFLNRAQASYTNLSLTVTTLLFTAGISCFVVSIMASVVWLIINIVKSFNSRLFNDEAYLTLTLPVSTKSLITSKLICNLVWVIAIALVTYICATVSSVIVVSSVASFDGAGSMGEVVKEFASIDIVDALATIINLFIQTTLFLILLFFSLCVLNVGKIRGAKTMFGIFIFGGTVMCVNFICNAMNAFLSFGIIDNGYGIYKFVTGNEIYVINFTDWIVRIGLSIGLYFASISLYKNKLELE